MSTTRNSLQTNLNKLLRQYQKAPHAITGESPSKLFLGRNVRTRLEIVRPQDVSTRISQKQQIFNSSFRELQSGQRVYFLSGNSRMDNSYNQILSFCNSKNTTILLATNAHRRSNDMRNPVLSNKGYKYKNIIAPLMSNKNIIAPGKKLEEWLHSMEKVNTGSIYSIAWSSDSTQVAMACGNGKLLTAHIIDRRLEWDNYEAMLIRRKVIEVKEVGNEVHEVLEISDRVVHLEFGFGHLVVITPAQCHIYSVTNWNTPAIFNLKRSIISAVLLAEKHFLIVEFNTMSLYNYQGRLLGTPRWKGFTEEPLYTPCLSLCADTLVIRNQTNEKLLHILEISYNKPIVEGQSYSHLHGVMQLALSYISIKDRHTQLALIDVNKDLFLIAIRTTGFERVCKIAAMAQNIVWATDANVLAAMLDTNLSVWLCPNCVHYSDRKVIRRTRIDKESSEFGKQPSIVSVRNGMVMVRRGDGAIVATLFYNLFKNLYEHTSNKRLKEALSICRIAQNEILWTCMAVMATDNKELHAAEEAYAAIGRFDIVDYIKYIKSLPNTTERCAEMALLAGDLLAAEGILLQSGLIKEAIHINLEVYNWNRALELAIRHKRQLEEVLNARAKYLHTINKNETNQSFLTHIENISTPQLANKESNEKKIYVKNDVEQIDVK
ncbi:intraflagellar transport protein 80 homolog [Formica exsecta]|uniref:intraflagellar transport protein 80 homolog n=1 Tax=Formica exsecta TaxID=72781 RepID=UPI001141BA4E|nr:intraflagellar transport protein 80 homolog [Formica exsecta]